MYIRNRLWCIDTVETVIYSSPMLVISSNIDCWCEMELGTKNGLEKFVTYNHLKQELYILPCCSSIHCKTLGFKSRKSKK